MLKNYVFSIVGTLLLVLPYNTAFSKEQYHIVKLPLPSVVSKTVNSVGFATERHPYITRVQAKLGNTIIKLKNNLLNKIDQYDYADYLKTFNPGLAETTSYIPAQKNVIFNTLTNKTVVHETKALPIHEMPEDLKGTLENIDKNGVIGGLLKEQILSVRNVYNFGLGRYENFVINLDALKDHKKYMQQPYYNPSIGENPENGKSPFERILTAIDRIDIPGKDITWLHDKGYNDAIKPIFRKFMELCETQLDINPLTISYKKTVINNSSNSEPVLEAMEYHLLQKRDKFCPSSPDLCKKVNEKLAEFNAARIHVNQQKSEQYINNQSI